MDVRSPREFEKAHISSSVNIPIQELHSKLGGQRNKRDLIVLYCATDQECEGDREKPVVQFCTSAAFLLRRLGFSQVEVVTSTIETLKATGVPITD